MPDKEQKIHKIVLVINNTEMYRGEVHVETLERPVCWVEPFDKEWEISDFLVGRGLPRSVADRIADQIIALMKGDNT